MLHSGINLRGISRPLPALDAREEDTNAHEAEERDKHAQDERLVAHEFSHILYKIHMRIQAPNAPKRNIAVPN
jgi:hypothetical protein